MVEKFPEQILHKFSDMLFLSLAAGLAAADGSTVREAAASVIMVLDECRSVERSREILEENV